MALATRKQDKKSMVDEIISIKEAKDRLDARDKEVRGALFDSMETGEWVASSSKETGKEYLFEKYEEQKTVLKSVDEIWKLVTRTQLMRIVSITITSIKKEFGKDFGDLVAGYDYETKMRLREVKNGK